MNTLLLTVAAASAMTSATALAQDALHSEHHGGWTQDMSRAQAQEFADQMFQRLDTNHDGTLTRAEADAAAAQMGGGGRGGRMLDRLFNGAGSVTQAQAEVAALARFDAEDSNHDGAVSVAERQAARARRQGGQ